MQLLCVHFRKWEGIKGVLHATNGLPKNKNMPKSPHTAARGASAGAYTHEVNELCRRRHCLANRWTAMCRRQPAVDGSDHTPTVLRGYHSHIIHVCHVYTCYKIEQYTTPIAETSRKYWPFIYTYKLASHSWPGVNSILIVFICVLIFFFAKS